MPDRTAFDPSCIGLFGDPHTMGFSGERNGFVLNDQHPQLSSVLMDLKDKTNMWQFRYCSSFKPANGQGMRSGSGRTTEVLRRIAHERLELPMWAFALKLDWGQREQQREWDFLVQIYGEQQANDSPGMHPLDQAAFSEYISSYDMWDCAFTGSVQGVQMLL